MVGGGQGGTFNASREVWAFGHKHWLGLTCISFDLSLIFLGGIELSRAMLQNEITCPLSQGKLMSIVCILSYFRFYLVWYLAYFSWRFCGFL